MDEMSPKHTTSTCRDMPLGQHIHCSPQITLQSITRFQDIKELSLCYELLMSMSYQDFPKMVEQCRIAYFDVVE